MVNDKDNSNPHPAAASRPEGAATDTTQAPVSDAEAVVEQNRRMVAMTRMIRIAMAYKPEDTRKALRVMASVEAMTKDGAENAQELQGVWVSKWNEIQEAAKEAVAEATRMAQETQKDAVEWSEELFRQITIPAIEANKDQALPLVNQLRVVGEALTREPENVGYAVKMREICDQLEEISAAGKQGLYDK